MNPFDTENQELILVNEQDEVIGTLPKMATHQQGLLHRAFSVMLYRHNAEGKREVLLQQRHPAKYHCGGLWTNTCCGHPSPHETALAAATRRLYEETGIEAELTPNGTFRYYAGFANGLIEHELDHVFTAPFEATPQQFNRQEITTMKWMPVELLQQELDEHPELYTPWLERVLKLLP